MSVSAEKKTTRGLSAPVKASIAFVAINIFQKGIAFLSTPIYTRILSMEDYGVSTVFYSIMQIIGVFAMFSLHAGVFNNGMLEFHEDRDSYMFSTLVLSNIITLAVAGVCAVFFKPISAILGELDVKFWYLMFAVFFLQPAFHFWTARQRYEHKYKVLGAITLISSAMSCSLSIVVVRSGVGEAVSARLFGAEIPFLLVYAIFYVLLALRGKLKINWKYVKYAFWFNLPLLPHYLSVYIMISADRVMIRNFVGAGQAALYSVACSLTSLITVFWTAISASLTPFVYESCKAGREGEISKVTIPIVMGYGLMCFGVILFAPEIIALLSPKIYRQAVFAIPPLICGVFLQSFYSVFSMLIYYNRKPVYVMIASVAGAMLNIVLNILLIPNFGYISAGYTTMFSFAIQAIIDYVVMQKITNGRIYSGKVFVVLAVAMVLLVLLANVLYTHPSMRYSAILILLVVAVLRRKRIVKIIRFAVHYSK